MAPSLGLADRANTGQVLSMRALLQVMVMSPLSFVFLEGGAGLQYQSQALSCWLHGAQSRMAFAEVQDSLCCCFCTASVPVALVYMHLGIPTSTLHHMFTAAHFKVSVLLLSKLFIFSPPSALLCFPA